MKTIKFDLSTTFKKVPEGQRALTITKCEATPSGNPSAVKITWSDVEGGSIQETINFDKALWKISQICSYALDVVDGEEMAVNDMCKKLINKTLLCEVVHRQGTRPRDDGTFATFPNVNKILGKVETIKEDMSTVDTSNENVDNPRETILAGL